MRLPNGVVLHCVDAVASARMTNAGMSRFASLCAGAVMVFAQLLRCGTGLRQLTDGPWDDIEPSYLPDGSIVFASSRCQRWVNCWLTQVAILCRSDVDGRNLQPLSSNNEHDNTPWPLPDGRILYTRWEYVDRSQVDYHLLWVVNPDGTGHSSVLHADRTI